MQKKKKNAYNQSTEYLNEQKKLIIIKNTKGSGILRFIQTIPSVQKYENWIFGLWKLLSDRGRGFLKGGAASNPCDFVLRFKKTSLLQKKKKDISRYSLACKLVWPGKFHYRRFS